MTLSRGPLESFALLTALPVPAAGRTSTRGVLPWAPLVGLVLGAAAAAVAWAGARLVSPPVGAVLAVVALASLTRGLHLDGLADTADGLGPLRGREGALAAMRRSDIGPFGVLTLVLTLLVQVACLAAVLPADGGWLVLPVAVLAARLAMARTGLPGVAMAAGSVLGASVAGTISSTWLAGTSVLAALGTIGAGAAVSGLELGARLYLAALVGLLAAELLHRRVSARLGGVTGDVMGAMGEVTTTVTVLAAAVLLP